MHAQGSETKPDPNNKRQRSEEDDVKSMAEPPTKKQKTSLLDDDDEDYLRIPKHPKIPKQFEELAIVQSTENDNNIPPIPMLEPLPTLEKKTKAKAQQPPIKRKRSRPSKKSNKKRKKQRKRKDIIAENERSLTDEDREEMQRICDKLGICDGYNVGVCLYHFDSHPEVYRFIEKVYDENDFELIHSKVFDFVCCSLSLSSLFFVFICALMCVGS